MRRPYFSARSFLIRALAYVCALIAVFGMFWAHPLTAAAEDSFYYSKVGTHYISDSDPVYNHGMAYGVYNAYYHNGVRCFCLNGGLDDPKASDDYAPVDAGQIHSNGGIRTILENGFPYNSAYWSARGLGEEAQWQATQLAIWMYVQINDSSYHGKNYNANHHTRYGNLTGEDAAGMADTLYRIAHYGDASVKIPHRVEVQEKSVEEGRLTFVIQAENLSGYEGSVTGIDGSESLWLNGEPITLTDGQFHSDTGNGSDRLTIQLKKSASIQLDLTGYYGEYSAELVWFESGKATTQNMLELRSLTFDTGQTTASGQENVQVCGFGKVKKVCSETGRELDRALLGFYRDEGCSELAAQSAGGQEVQLDPGTYYVREITAPPGYYNSRAVMQIEVKSGETAEIILKNDRIKGRIELEKRDLETEQTVPQGDAALSGAVYGLYAAEPILHPDNRTGQLYGKDQLVAEMTTGSQAKAVLEDLYLGSYYIRELNRSTGYELNAKIYPVTIADPGQDTPVVTVDAPVEEQVIRQAVELHKTTDEGTLLDHSGFCFYLRSDLVKLGLKQKPDGSYDYRHFDFSLAEPLKAGENGETVIYTNTDHLNQSIVRTGLLPYGVYIVAEQQPTELPNKEYETAAPIEIEIPFDGVHRMEDIEWSMLPEPGNLADPDKSEGYQHVNVMNRVYRCRLKLVKKDKENQEPLLKAGVLFEIYDSDNHKVIQYQETGSRRIGYEVYETSADGSLRTYEPLRAGVYLLKEIQPPEGYLPAKDILIEIYSDQVSSTEEGERVQEAEVISGSGGDTAVVEVLDQPIRVCVHKVETGSEGEIHVPDAKLCLYKAEKVDPKLIEISETDGETAARYPAVRERFVWKERTLADQTVVRYVEKENVTETVRLYINIKLKEPVLIETDGGDLLAYLADETGAKETVPGAAWTTEDAGHSLMRIPSGHYILEELQAPCHLGYVASLPMGIYVPALDEELNVYFEDSYTTLEVHKLDAENAKPLSGASFAIYCSDKSGGRGELYEEFVTDGTPIEFTRIPPGFYIMEETKAPDGYQKAKPVHFEITETADRQKLIVYNRTVTESVPETPVETTPAPETVPAPETRVPAQTTPAPSDESLAPNSSADTGDTFADLVWIAIFCSSFGLILFISHKLSKKHR